MSEGHRLDKKVDHSYEELKALLLASDRDFDMEKIDAAYQFALKSHGDQKRRSGVPYILHPVSVAYILVELAWTPNPLWLPFCTMWWRIRLLA